MEKNIHPVTLWKNCMANNFADYFEIKIAILEWRWYLQLLPLPIIFLILVFIRVG